MKKAELDTIIEFLNTNRVLVLATQDSDGHPYTTSLYYVQSTGPVLYFLSSSKKEHSIHLKHNSHISFSIFEDPGPRKQIRGIQAKGTCSKIQGRKLIKEVRAQYLKKYPQISASKELIARLIGMSYYEIQPHWLKWLDNSVRFGYSKTWDL